MLPKALAKAHSTFFILYVASLATSMSGMEVFSGLLTLTLLARLYFERDASLKLRAPFLKPMIAFAVVMAISVMLGDATSAEKFRDVGRVRFFLLYLILFYHFCYFGHEVRWATVQLVVVLVVSIYGIVQHFMPLDLVHPQGDYIQYAIQKEKIGPLTNGTYSHHLTFANIYVLYGCVLLGIGVLGGRVRWPYIIVAGLALLASFWTQSRTAWLAIPVGILGILYFKSRQILAAGIGLLATMFAGSYFLDAGFYERLRRTFTGDSLYGGSDRFRLWRVQIEMWKEHPWLGIGYNNNERHGFEYLRRFFPDVQTHFNGHAHSTPLQILATTGIFGVAAFLWLWISIFRKCAHLIKASTAHPARQALAVGLTMAMVTFHIQGLTQWNFGDAEVAHNLFFYLAILGCLAVRPAQVEP